jgi:hypothetical protein
VRQTRGVFGWPFAPWLNPKLDLFIECEPFIPV